jgi:hypothetical protein
LKFWLRESMVAVALTVQLRMVRTLGLLNLIFQWGPVAPTTVREWKARTYFDLFLLLRPLKIDHWHEQM